MKRTSLIPPARPVKTRKTLTVYQRIMKAAKAGRGLNLTADDVFLLTQDNAIETRATRDDFNRDGSPDVEHY